MNNTSSGKNILVTAHRGASAIAPENTMASVIKAVELKADFIEIDVQETKDGKIVLLHDVSLKRTAGVKKNIASINFDELKSYEVGKWFDDSYFGEHIPSLEEVIESVKGKAKLNIELKSSRFQFRLAERVLEIVKSLDFINDCIVTSFDFVLINKIKILCPELKAGYIVSLFSRFMDFNLPDVDLIAVHKKLATKSFIEKITALGKEIYVWTVDDENEMNRFINLNVDGIITNDPAKLIYVLNNQYDDVNDRAS